MLPVVSGGGGGERVPGGSSEHAETRHVAGSDPARPELAYASSRWLAQGGLDSQ